MMDDLVHELSLPELFDEGVEVARNALVAGSSIASAFMAAAAWYDNPLVGVAAVLDCMKLVGKLPLDSNVWRSALVPYKHPQTGDDFVPGFGFVPSSTALAIVGACGRLAANSSYQRNTCRFYFMNHHDIEPVSGKLNQAGLVALTFVDANVATEDVERLFMVWRVQVAVKEAQAARRRGLASFPFFAKEYSYEGRWPKAERLDLELFMKESGVV